MNTKSNELNTQCLETMRAMIAAQQDENARQARIIRELSELLVEHMALENESRVMTNADDR